MTNPLTHWKTSLSGLLGFLIASGAVITAMPNHIVSQKVSGIATLIVGLGRAWLGLIQQDAGTVMAIPAGKTQPVAVPSTEVPIDPNATLVPPKE